MPLEVAASIGWLAGIQILLPVTNPLEKFENLSIAEMIKQEGMVSSETQFGNISHFSTEYDGCW